MFGLQNVWNTESTMLWEQGSACLVCGGRFPHMSSIRVVERALQRQRTVIRERMCLRRVHMLVYMYAKKFACVRTRVRVCVCVRAFVNAYVCACACAFA